MHRRIHVFKIFLAIILIAVLFLPSAIMAKGGDGMGSIALINTANYDLRLDIGTAEGPFRWTDPDNDTVALPIKMYGHQTDIDTGLVIDGFFNRIYYDSTELLFAGFGSDYWGDSVSTEVEHYSGDIVYLDIQCWSDTVELPAQTWTDIYSLKFFIKCQDQDEIQIDLWFDDDPPENYVKIMGQGANEDYDQVDDGYIDVMAYWASFTVDSVETLLGVDTVKVPVYLDSLNFLYYAFKHYLEYDGDNYTFVEVERSDSTSTWFWLGNSHNGDSVCVTGADIANIHEPPTEPIELYKLVFVSNATSDDLSSPITWIGNADSNFVVPSSMCNDFYETIDIDTAPGKITIPEYRMDAKLEFLDEGTVGDTVTLAVKVKQNFPAGLYDTGDIQFLIKHDSRFNYFYDYDNVHDSVYVNVTRINDTYIGINLNFPNGRPGYLPPSEEYETYIELELEISSGGTFSCPDELIAAFDATYGTHYATSATDTTGNITCNTVNGKLVDTPDTLDLTCALVDAGNASGTSSAQQSVYVDHNFEMDSIYVELDYNSTYFCLLNSSLETGITLTAIDGNTIALHGSNLGWSADDADWLANLNWGAKSYGPRQMTVDVKNSDVYDSDDKDIFSKESDGTVSTNLPVNQVRPCPFHNPKKPESLPEQFALHQNCPNPFNPVTVISFDLPEAANVKLEVFNILGQKVENLVDDYLDAGKYNITWDSRSSDVPSGVYFYVIQAGKFSESKKMLLLK
jgi:hypothetical protein